jgi:hypothetical protein
MAVKPKTSHIVAYSRCSPLGSFGLGLTWIGRFSAGYGVPKWARCAPPGDHFKGPSVECHIPRSYASQ